MKEQEEYTSKLKKYARLLFSGNHWLPVPVGIKILDYANIVKKVERSPKIRFFSKPFSFLNRQFYVVDKAERLYPLKKEPYALYKLLFNKMDPQADYIHPDSSSTLSNGFFIFFKLAQEQLGHPLMSKTIRASYTAAFSNEPVKDSAFFLNLLYYSNSSYKQKWIFTFWLCWAAEQPTKEPLDDVQKWLENEPKHSKYEKFCMENTPVFNKRVQTACSALFKTIPEVKTISSLKISPLAIADRSLTQDLTFNKILEYKQAQLILEYQRQYLTPRVHEIPRYIKTVFTHYSHYDIRRVWSYTENLSATRIVALIFEILKEKYALKNENFSDAFAIYKDRVFSQILKKGSRLLLDNNGHDMLLLLDALCMLVPRQTLLEHFFIPWLIRVQNLPFYNAWEFEATGTTVCHLVKNHWLDRTTQINTFYACNERLQRAMFLNGVNLPVPRVFKTGVGAIMNLMRHYFSKLSDSDLFIMQEILSELKNSERILKHAMQCSEYRYTDEIWLLTCYKFLSVVFYLNQKIQSLCKKDGINFSNLVCVLNDHLNTCHSLRLLSMLYYKTGSYLKQLLQEPLTFRLLCRQLLLPYFKLAELEIYLQAFDEILFETYEIHRGNMPIPSSIFFRFDNPYDTAHHLFSTYDSIITDFDEEFETEEEHNQTQPEAIAFGHRF